MGLVAQAPERAKATVGPPSFSARGRGPSPQTHTRPPPLAAVRMPPVGVPVTGPDAQIPQVPGPAPKPDTDRLASLAAAAPPGLARPVDAASPIRPSLPARKERGDAAAARARPTITVARKAMGGDGPTSGRGRSRVPAPGPWVLRALTNPFLQTWALVSGLPFGVPSSHAARELPRVRLRFPGEAAETPSVGDPVRATREAGDAARRAKIR